MLPGSVHEVKRKERRRIWPDNLKRTLQNTNIEYLQLLDLAANDELIQNGGLWHNIIWEYEAANQVYSYCSGHPYLSHLFAKQVCKDGDIKHISAERVQEKAREIASNINNNEFGRYFEKSIWGRLSSDGKKLVTLINQEGNHGLSVKSLPPELQEVAFQLVDTSIVSNDVGKLFHFTPFFSKWLEYKIQHDPASVS